MSYTNSAVSGPNAFYSVPLLSSPQTYIVTLDPATLPADAVIIVPASGYFELVTDGTTKPRLNIWLISSDSCVTDICGNGVVDAGEDCDDGNTSNNDGCNTNCELEYCGDGIIQSGEDCDDGNNLDGNGCSSVCELEESSGGYGCTPGYWKQSQHFDSWTEPYTPDMLFSDVFEDAFPGMTLLQVLKKGGGGVKALGRHTVADLLDARSADVSYDLTVSQVIMMFNSAYPGRKNDYNSVKNIFEGFNEQGCPLN